MDASGPYQLLFVQCFSYLGGFTWPERKDERGSGEDRCFFPVQTKSSVQGEVAVIHALRRILHRTPLIGQIS